MSQLTTHILDTSAGKPAAGVHVSLEHYDSGSWNAVANGITDDDGRIRNLFVGRKLSKGDYRLIFNTADYFNTQNKKSFYPKVTVEFTIEDDSHYHVPLLLNPFGYSTYRGT
jgi:hydroxyisourate hydrolase